MEDLDVSKDEQSGGWFNVSIISIEELFFCPDFLTNSNAETIVVDDDEADSVDILPVGESIKIRETSKKTKAGYVYTIKGEFEFDYQSKEIDDYLNRFVTKKVILIGIKHFGSRKIYGSKRFPLNFSYQLIDGKKYEDGTRIRVVLSGKIPQKPVFINN